MPALVSFALQPWIGITALAVVTFTLGIWIDAALKTFDAKRPTKQQRYRSLGTRAIKLAMFLVDHRQRAFKLQTNNQYFAEVNSLFVRFRKMGIETPAPPDSAVSNDLLRYAENYFSQVGPLLRDGNVDEAKRMAVILADEISEL